MFGILLSAVSHAPSPSIYAMTLANRYRKRTVILLAGFLAVLIFGFYARADIRAWWLTWHSTESLRERAASESDSLAAIVLARRFREEGSDEEAWEVLRRTAASIPTNDRSRQAASTWALAGYLGSRFGEEEEALPFLERAARLDPRDYLIPLGRGILLMRQREKDRAIRMFEEAARLDPENDEVWTRLGTARMEVGHLVSAIEALKRAAHLAPGSAAHHADLGEALARGKKFREAAREFQRAVELDPSQTTFRTLLATAGAQAARTDAEY